MTARVPSKRAGGAGRWLVLAWAAAACGPPPAAEEEEEAPLANFIALTRDFEGYEGWTAQALSGEPGTGDELEDAHLTGPRTVYWKLGPGPAEGRFPVGTMLVKATASGRTFAMVKRGGDYNKSAPGWEWFELERSKQGVPVISWRGTGPPLGASYNHGAETCNACHASAQGNDFVRSVSLATP